MRNPKWKRDELILALDLYFKEPSARGSKSHPKVIELSALLNSLPIHKEEKPGENFRNPNGVAMKLSNFLVCDPEYAGKGLERGAKLEQEIWDEFASDRGRLFATAQAIKNNYGSLQSQINLPEEIDYDDLEAQEGTVLTRIHKLRERNPSIVKKKKEAVLKKFGALECEACGFNFTNKYGEIGEGFIECHHEKPISELEPGEKTKLDDLRIVCANCHRIIHRRRPWRTVEELRQVIERNQK